MTTLISESLKRAIQCYEGDTGPGVWTAEEAFNEHPEHVGIVYTVRDSSATPGLAKSVSELDDAVYFARWGGDAILLSAGLMLDPAQTHTDAFIDEVDGVMEFCFSARVTPFVSNGLVN